MPDPTGPTADELAALEELGEAGTWTIDGHEIALTNLDKVLFPARPPEPGRAGSGPLTKRDLVRHLTSLAPTLLPYLTGRPVNLLRAPDGVGGSSFWQKALPAGAPGWLARWDDPDAREGRTTTYLVIDRVATLAYVANLAALELHPWISTTADSHEPSWALVDIDPGPRTSFDDVRELARLHGVALDQLGVRGCPKVTGSRGIQIWIPIASGATFAQTLAWVEDLSRVVADTVPDLVSWAWRTGEREGKARLDFTQNGRSRTLVAPWSPRAAPGAPVSVPITWDELDDPALAPDRWSITSVGERLAEHGDPLAELIGLEQPLPPLG